MNRQVITELREQGYTLVDTMEQVSQVIEVAAVQWPVTTERYGWDCVPFYDDKQKRWRFQVRCLAPFGVPDETERTQEKDQTG
ncbi:MAG: hypothetical protein N2491_13845 [Negativicutes bacterium]|nr:hypothetical protein [Negativicutes bacterium]